MQLFVPFVCPLQHTEAKIQQWTQLWKEILMRRWCGNQPSPWEPVLPVAAHVAVCGRKIQLTPQCLAKKRTVYLRAIPSSTDQERSRSGWNRLLVFLLHRTHLCWPTGAEILDGAPPVNHLICSLNRLSHKKRVHGRHATWCACFSIRTV